MLFTKLLIPTLKDAPQEAEIVSHQLMLRAGMIRKVASGIYTWLPLGLKVLKKIETIVREEMDASGAQEVFMPMVQPRELWEETNRWEKMGPELLRIKDRHEREDGTKFQPINELFYQAENFLKSLFETYSDSNKTILIVAHNAILRCLILKLINDPSKGFRRLKLDNTSISILNIDFNNWEERQVQIQCLNNIAHLHPSLPKKNSKKRIILVRHGETDWNKQGRFQGQIDIPLNQNGKAQAQAASQFLKGVSIQKAFSSSLSRPKETAQIILKEHPGIEISLKDNLKEIGHGKWEGKLESEIKSDWPDLLKAWKKLEGVVIFVKKKFTS